MKLLFLIICIVYSGPFVSFSHEQNTEKHHLNKPVDNKRKFHIYMVLWDGSTAIEKGVKAVFQEHNVAVEYTVQDCKADRKKCHALIHDIRNKKPDLIYTWGTPAIEEIAGKATNATHEDDYIRDIPIVATAVSDPLGSGIIKNLHYPGRNVTGVNHIPPVEAQISSMLAYKKVQKIALMFVEHEKISMIFLPEVRQTVQKNNITCFDANYEFMKDEKSLDTTQMDNFFEKLKQENCELVYIPPSNMLAAAGKEISDAACKHKIMLFVVTPNFLSKGAPLMGFVSNYFNIGQLAGQKMIQILIDHEDVRTLPFEKLEQFSFFINKDIMRALEIYPALSIIEETIFISSNHSLD